MCAYAEHWSVCCCLQAYALFASLLSCWPPPRADCLTPLGLPHEDGGIPLKRLIQGHNKWTSRLFLRTCASVLSVKQESCEHHFEVFWYDSTKKLIPGVHTERSEPLHHSACSDHWCSVKTSRILAGFISTSTLRKGFINLDHHVLALTAIPVLMSIHFHVFAMNGIVKQRRPMTRRNLNPNLLTPLHFPAIYVISYVIIPSRSPIFRKIFSNVHKQVPCVH